MLVKSLHNQILCICITIFVYMYDVIYNDIIKAPIVIPSHLLNHRVVETANLIPKKLANALLEDIKHDRSFPTNAQDTRFYKILHEHIGEAIDINEDGTCSHYLMVPNKDKTKCILPNRIDIASHFMQSGGFNALKNEQALMVSRILSFGRYHFNLTKKPIIAKLFQSKKFQQLAKNVCPKQKQILDPFQFNIIMQVPGQTVPVHIDGVYFFGATRFQFPQWLLAVMKFSGLFEHIFINQIQVVGYLHQWTPTMETGGSFVYWNNDDLSKNTGIVQPLPRAGTGVDGSKVVHAANVYRPNEMPPRISKDKSSELYYVGDDKWVVREMDDPDNVLRNYTTNDLRISIVYRGRCFASEEKAKLFNDNLHNHDNALKLDDILNRLLQDLVNKNKITQSSVDTMSRFEIAETLLKNYIRYPKSPTEISKFPFNYCIASVKFPFLKSILSPFCDSLENE